MKESIALILKLVKDVPAARADSILIHAALIGGGANYYLGGMQVSPVDERAQDRIEDEDVIEVFRVLAGDDLVNEFLEQVEQSGHKRVALRDTVVKLDNEYFRLTYGMKQGAVIAKFTLLDPTRTSKWEPLLDQVAHDYLLEEVALKLGDYRGKAKIKLTASQHSRLKAFLLELEQDNFAPAEKD